MSYDLFVEIGSGEDPAFRERLLAAVYRASRSCSVALVLRGVTPEELDDVLDPIVREHGVGSAGVDYLDPDEGRSRLRSNGVGRTVVMTRDPAWLDGASGPGTRVVSPEEGLAHVEDELTALEETG